MTSTQKLAQRARVMSKKKEKPQEVAPTEAKQEARQQQQQPKEQAKQQQPTQKPKPSNPVIKRITWSYFERFNPNKPNGKSWVKETIERAKKEPVMVKNLKKGQIMALVNQIDRHNMNSDHKIVYKCDVKRGIVLLAPKDALIARLRQQGEGEQK
jgi:flagellar biosynthesis GTPase FlhF